MASHFQCIGLGVENAEAFKEMVSRLLDQATEDAPATPPYRHLRWTDASGAALAFHVDAAGAIDCVTPFFAPADGLSTWPVRSSQPAWDPGCANCGGADCDIARAEGEWATRCTVQWLHFAPDELWLANAPAFALEVVAFAHSAWFFTSVDTLNQHMRRESSATDRAPAPAGTMAVSWAGNFFMQDGMATKDAAVSTQARALFAGEVTHTERRINTVTGRAFQRIRVDTLPGPIDVVLDPASVHGQPDAGRIALIQGWLVGRAVRPVSG